MKSKLPAGFVAAAVVSLVAFTCVAGELVILQPTGEDAVWLMSKRKMDYLALPLAERATKFADAGERGILAAEPNAPTPVLVSWRWTARAGAKTWWKGACREARLRGRAHFVDDCRRRGRWLDCRACLR